MQAPELTSTARPGYTVLGTYLPRKEDDRLLRGAGQFTDDVGRARTAEMAVGRCPYPHARIAAIDASAAAALDGVLEIITGAEVAAGTGPIAILRPVPGAPVIPHFALALETATYEGQPVVSVAATSRHIAEDALELIEIEYEPLPHVCDVVSALAPGAPVIHPGTLESNLLASNPQGRGDVAARMDEADVVVEGRFHVNRVTGLPMETRAVLAEWRSGADALTVHTSTQAPHLMRTQLADSLRIDEGDIRVVTLDVGGGFGLKLGAYPEDLLACLHAISLRRPVKFTEDRNEHFRATTHGRESVHDYRIAARSDGRILAMTDVYTNDLGGLNSPFGSSQLSTVVFNGPYKVDDGFVERRIVVTNKTPIGAYRGYGQPEVNFAYERLMDKLARRLGADPVELRAMNMVRPDEFPWVNPVGAVYDSGDYERCLRMAADAVGWAAHRDGGHEPRAAGGRYPGIGFSCYVERTGYASSKFLAARGSRFGAHESVTIRANRRPGSERAGVERGGACVAGMNPDPVVVASEELRAHLGEHGLAALPDARHPGVHVEASGGVLGLHRRAGPGRGSFSILWTSATFLLSGPPYHYGSAVIGLFSLAGLAGAVAAPQTGRLADRGYGRLGTLGTIVILLASWGLLALGGHWLGALIPGIVLLDLGAQALHISNQSDIYALRAEVHSRLNTAYMVAYFTGGAVMSAAASLVFSAAGWDGVCVLGILTAAAGLAIWPRTRHRPAAQ